jgi:predicted DNA-binding transcriptional regulator AlpA
MRLKETCEFFGGIDPSTLYPGMRANPPRYPSPVKVGPNLNRWVHEECEAALQRMIHAPRTRRPISDAHREALHQRNKQKPSTANKTIAADS